jgi:hypothetical protein
MISSDPTLWHSTSKRTHHKYQFAIRPFTYVLLEKSGLLVQSVSHVPRPSSALHVPHDLLVVARILAVYDSLCFTKLTKTSVCVRGKYFLQLQYNIFLTKEG